MQTIWGCFVIVLGVVDLKLSMVQFKLDWGLVRWSGVHFLVCIAFFHEMSVYGVTMTQDKSYKRSSEIDLQVPRDARATLNRA